MHLIDTKPTPPGQPVDSKPEQYEITDDLIRAIDANCDKHEITDEEKALFRAWATNVINNEDNLQRLRNGTVELLGFRDGQPVLIRAHVHWFDVPVTPVASPAAATPTVTESNPPKETQARHVGSL